MPYTILHHTADVRLQVTAATLEELFSDALRGLMEVMEAVPAGGAEESETIALDSVDATALLVDFLNEVLTRAVVRRRLYRGASFASLGETHLAGTLIAVPAAAVAEDVKAVTYHEADVRHERGAWTTTLVLDI